jgi:uncharacterized membrane protein
MMADAGHRTKPRGAGLSWLGWGGALLAAVSPLVGAAADWLPLGTPYKRNLAAGTLQLVLLALAAGALATWGAGRWRRPSLKVSARAARLAVTGGVLAYAAGLSAMSLVRHRALLTGIWDLGYYAQITWGLAQLQVPRSSVWYDAPWGNHSTFILLLAAPFLSLFGDPAALLVLQSAVLALGAVPAYLLGDRVWGEPLGGLAAAGAYLLYPPLQFANLFDFHADTFATPLLLAAFAALFAGRPGWAMLWAGALVLVKEDMALVAVTFGVYAAAVHRRRGGLALAAGAAAVFALLVWVIIPAWIDRPYFSLFNRWAYLGNTPGELILSPVLRPAAFFGALLHPERLGYLLLLLAPLAGLPLLAPEVLAVGLPPLVSNLLSTAEAQYTIRAQYTATLTPILLAAATVGSRRAADWLQRCGLRRTAPLAGLAATTLMASLAFSPLPWSQDVFARKQFWDGAPRRALAAIASHVPAEASLSAANHLGAHLALRRHLYLFPHGVDTAEFVLLDVGGRDYVGAAPNPETFRPLLRSLVESRPLVAVQDGLALFGQGKPSPDGVARLVALRAVPAPDARPAGAFALVAGSVHPSRLAPREHLRARYTWLAAAPASGVPCVAEALMPASGPPVWEDRRPLFHGLLRTERWPAGWAADDAVVVTVPETVPPGAYTWTVTTWIDGKGDGCAKPPEASPGVALSQIRILPW